VWHGAVVPNRRAVADWVALAVGALSSAVLVVANPHHSGAVALIVAGAAAALWLGLRRTSAVPPWTLWTVAVVLAAIAVARAPLGSHDLWSYAAYGRLFEHYHADVYHTVPARFPHDPIIRLVGTGWLHTTSAYGPLFVGFAAAVTRIAGVHLLAVRLAFQLTAAASVLGATAIAAHALPRHERHRAIALIALQPLVWSSFVNGGHNDVYLGLAAVAAIALVQRGRATSAGIVLGLAGLVKLTALLALPVLALWLLTRRETRGAVRLLVAAVVPTVIGALVAPASLTSAAHTTAGRISRASPWRVLTSGIVSPTHASTLSVLATIAVVATIAWRHRRVDDVAAPVALALGAYTIVGSYFLPWYVAWSLPAAAMTRRRAPAALLTIHGALLFAAYQIGPVHAADGFGVAGINVLTYVAPVVTVAALLALAWWVPTPATSTDDATTRGPVDAPVRETAL
jgi:alpha-1,6-mannosyltransferase